MVRHMVIFLVALTAIAPRCLGHSRARYPDQAQTLALWETPSKAGVARYVPPSSVSTESTSGSSQFWLFVLGILAAAGAAWAEKKNPGTLGVVKEGASTFMEKALTFPAVQQALALLGLAMQGQQQDALLTERALDPRLCQQLDAVAPFMKGVDGTGTEEDASLVPPDSPVIKVPDIPVPEQDPDDSSDESAALDLLGLSPCEDEVPPLCAAPEAPEEEDLGML